MAEKSKRRCATGGGLENRLDMRIRFCLEGRKRVSVALELLTEPLLILMSQHPVSTRVEAQMMSLFANLSRKGRMLMVATHAMQSLNSCSVLMVLMKGHLIFIGAPSDALTWFEVTHFSVF